MRRWLETGLAERVRAPKWSVRRADTCRPHPNQNCYCQADVRRFRAITGGENGGTSAVPNAGTCSGQSPTTLLLEYFFDLSDLFLNFAGVFFGVAFGL